MQPRKISVLIVDDNGYYVERMMTQLDGLENVTNINTAGDYKEAYKKLDTEEHDLVLLDINLPDGNGIDLLKEIKNPARNYNCEVIMISNNNGRYYQSECKKLGAKYFLDKTNDFDKVPELLAEICNN